MSPEVTYVLQSLGTVAVFGGALWVASHWLRRLGAGAANGPLEVIARQQLDGRRAIYLVRVGKRVLVVGAGDGALTKLGQTTIDALDLPAKVPVGDRGDRGFRDVLAKVMGRGRDEKDQSSGEG